MEVMQQSTSVRKVCRVRCQPRDFAQPIFQVHFTAGQAEVADFRQRCFQGAEPAWVLPIALEHEVDISTENYDPFLAVKASDFSAS